MHAEQLEVNDGTQPTFFFVRIWMMMMMLISIDHINWTFIDDMHICVWVSCNSWTSSICAKLFFFTLKQIFSMLDYIFNRFSFYQKTYFYTSDFDINKAGESEQIYITICILFEYFCLLKSIKFLSCSLLCTKIREKEKRSYNHVD
jgi:hypothetical protein